MIFCLTTDAIVWRKYVRTGLEECADKHGQASRQVRGRMRILLWTNIIDNSCMVSRAVLTKKSRSYSSQTSFTTSNIFFDQKVNLDSRCAHSRPLAPIRAPIASSKCFLIKVAYLDSCIILFFVSRHPALAHPRQPARRHSPSRTRAPIAPGRIIILSNTFESSFRQKNAHQQWMMMAQLISEHIRDLITKIIMSYRPARISRDIPIFGLIDGRNCVICLARKCAEGPRGRRGRMRGRVSRQTRTDAEGSRGRRERLRKCANVREST